MQNAFIIGHKYGFHLWFFMNFTLFKMFYFTEIICLRNFTDRDPNSNVFDGFEFCKTSGSGQFRIRNRIIFLNCCAGSTDPQTVCVEASLHYGLWAYGILLTLVLGLAGVRVVKKRGRTLGTRPTSATSAGAPANQQENSYCFYFLDLVTFSRI
jgi:hypothetical protein